MVSDKSQPHPRGPDSQRQTRCLRGIEEGGSTVPFTAARCRFADDSVWVSIFSTSKLSRVCFVLTFVFVFSSPSHNTVFEFWATLRALAKKHEVEQFKKSRLTVLDVKFSSFFIDGHYVSTGALATAYQSLLGETKSLLKTLSGRTQLPTQVPERDEKQDSHREVRPDYTGFPNKLDGTLTRLQSTLSQPSSPFFLFLFLFSIFLHKFAFRFIDSWVTQEERYSTEKMEAWVDKCLDLSLNLLTLIHLSSGMPARATELEMLTYVNSEHGQRSLFLARGKSSPAEGLFGLVCSGGGC